MVQVDLTHFELFKSFDEIESDGFYVDLHNEFKCEFVDFRNHQKELTLSFKLSDKASNKIKRVEIVFEDVAIESFIFKDSQEHFGEWTINNIYRGRFEISKDELNEISKDGRFYYYIDFYQGYSFELFANAVRAKLYE